MTENSQEEGLPRPSLRLLPVTRKPPGELEETTEPAGPDQSGAAPESSRSIASRTASALGWLLGKRWS